MKWGFSFNQGEGCLFESKIIQIIIRVVTILISYIYSRFSACGLFKTSKECPNCSTNKKHCNYSMFFPEDMSLEVDFTKNPNMHWHVRMHQFVQQGSTLFFGTLFLMRLDKNTNQYIQPVEIFNNWLAKMPNFQKGMFYEIHDDDDTNEFSYDF